MKKEIWGGDDERVWKSGRLPRGRGRSEGPRLSRGGFSGFGQLIQDYIRDEQKGLCGLGHSRGPLGLPGLVGVL